MPTEKSKLSAETIRVELERLAVALLDHERPECYREIYAAQQALAWALEPSSCKSPYDLIMHTPSEECRVYPCLPSS